MLAGMTRFARRVGSVLVLAMIAGSPVSAGATAEGSSEPLDRAARPRTETTLDGRSRSGQVAPPSRAPSAEPGREVAAPVNEGGFLGITGNPGISPSDTTGAGGPNHVVTAVNISYAVWPKDQLSTPPAAPAPLASGALRSLFPNLPGFVFDPKVVYDHYRGRYVLVFLMGQGGPFTGGPSKSRILIVTIPQATAHDPATWCKRKINGDQIKKDGKQFADYPGLGFDRKFLYVTTNQFSFGPREVFEYSQVAAIGKSRLYNCRGKIKVEAFGRKQTRSGGPAFTIMPAITQGVAGTGKAEFLASFNDRSCGPFCGNKMTIWRIKKRKGRLDLRRRVVAVPTGRLAPLGTQLGGSTTCDPIQTCWDAGDLRLVYAFHDADRDRLYVAHTVEADIAFGDGYVEAAVRWYEFDPSPVKRARLLRTGLLGASQRDAGWASMATDAAGNLHVTYSQAGAPAPGEYLSAYAATIPPGATVPDAVSVLVAGESTYVQSPGRPQRWGDFTAANRDPVDPNRVWLVNQYARSDGSPPTTPLWQQTVHRVSFG